MNSSLYEIKFKFNREINIIALINFKRIKFF